MGISEGRDIGVVWGGRRAERTAASSKPIAVPWPEYGVIAWPRISVRSDQIQSDRIGGGERKTSYMRRPKGRFCYSY